MSELACPFANYPLPCTDTEFGRAARICYDHLDPKGQAFPYSDAKFLPAYEACNKIWKEYLSRLYIEGKKRADIEQRLKDVNEAASIDFVNKIAHGLP